MLMLTGLATAVPANNPGSSQVEVMGEVNSQNTSLRVFL